MKLTKPMSSKGNKFVVLLFIIATLLACGGNDLRKVLYKPSPEIIVVQPINMETAVYERFEELTATPTPYPSDAIIQTATPLPSPTPRPMIVNDNVLTY